MRRLWIMTVLLLLGMVLLGGAIGCAKKQPEKLPVLPEVIKEGPDTIVPANMAIEVYVEKYYQAYQEKRWKEAYDLLPAAAKAKENLDQFTKMRSNLPLEKYVIKPTATQGSTATVTVELALAGAPQDSKWSTLWTFSKKGDKWIAESTKSIIGK